MSRSSPSTPLHQACIARSFLHLPYLNIVYFILIQQSIEVKVTQRLNRAIIIKTNQRVRSFLESSCRRALEGFHFYNSCVTERLWEKGVLLKRQACVWRGGMCIRRLYLVGMLCPGSVFIVMLKQECRCCVMKACKAAAVSFHLFSSGFTFFIYRYIFVTDETSALLQNQMSCLAAF